MKKQLLLLVSSAFLFASCGNNETSTPATNAPETASKTETPTAPAASTGTEMPKFSNADIQKLAEDYTAFMKEHVAAAKAGDAAKIQALQAKSVEWATNTNEALTKMTAEDAKLWTDWFTKLGQELAK